MDDVSPRGGYERTLKLMWDTRMWDKAHALPTGRPVTALVTAHVDVNTRVSTGTVSTATVIGFHGPRDARNALDISAGTPQLY